MDSRLKQHLLLPEGWSSSPETQVLSKLEAGWECYACKGILINFPPPQRSRMMSRPRRSNYMVKDDTESEHGASSWGDLMLEPDMLE